MFERAVVVGASGMIGRALTTALVRDGLRTIGTARRVRPDEALVTFDVTSTRLEEAVPDLGATDIVFHLAAIVGPDRVLADPALARAVNVDGALSVMRSAAKTDARIVYLSTESVFDGRDRHGYDETARRCPLTLYGRTKSDAEDGIGTTGANGRIVRVGWVVPPDANAPCPVASLYRAMDAPGGAMVATDNLLSLTALADLAENLARLCCSDFDSLPPVLHLSATPPVERSGIADLIAAHSRTGGAMRYRPVDFNDLPFKEPRPQHAWLRNEATLRTVPEIRNRSPKDTILEKIRILDDTVDAARRSGADQ